MLIVRKENTKKPKKMFNMYIKQKTIICENQLVNIVPENRWFKNSVRIADPENCLIGFF